MISGSTAGAGAGAETTEESEQRREAIVSNHGKIFTDFVGVRVETAVFLPSQVEYVQVVVWLHVDALCCILSVALSVVWQNRI